jgi:protocatechuate 3,4-dioxygenase beta subunit
MQRRDFIKNVGFGLASIGVGGLVLRSDAMPTPRSLDADDAELLFGTRQKETILIPQTADLKPTVARELGPFYRSGSPYRAKLTPPFEKGTVLIVTGRLWSFATKKPLANAALDLWQVDNQTKNYSNGNGDFKNRARLMTDENGAYEFETVHPVPYSPGPNFWRSPHIHFIAKAAGHNQLVSELFFKGDEKQDVDSLFHPSLAMPVQTKTVNGQKYESVVFDIVLEAGK